MELKKRCSACKKWKLWFFVRKRTYSGKNVVTGRVTSDTEICKNCHQNAKLLILGIWSYRHYKDYAIMRITNFFHDLKRPTETK